MYSALPRDWEPMKFATVDSLVRTMLAYPRRIRVGLVPNVFDEFAFEADDKQRFSISMEDFKKSSDDNTMKIKAFVKAMKTEVGKEEYCESLNYGKPDWNPDWKTCDKKL